MDLFKTSERTIAEPTVEGRNVYITMVDPEGDSTIPDLPWCSFKTLEYFEDLVTPGADEKKPVIVMCPDNQASVMRIRLAVENAGTCDIHPVQVTNVSTYAPSSMSESAFWAVQVINFDDWRLEVEEAVRVATLAERASTGADERRISDNAKASGTFKRVTVEPQLGLAPADTDVPAEDEDPPVF